MLYMQFGELVLVISNEFVSQFAELNVVIFSNLTSVRRTDPSTAWIWIWIVSRQGPRTGASHLYVSLRGAIKLLGLLMHDATMYNRGKVTFVGTRAKVT